MSEIYRHFYRWARLQYIYFHRRVMAQGTAATLTDLPILYEDNEVIIVNKRYDVKVNSDVEEDLTVATQLAHIRPDLVDPSLPHFIRFCHRLDYATSGVLCLAKKRNAARKCQKAFENRRVQKYYLALVRGHLMNEGKNSIEIGMSIGKRSDIEDRALMCPATHPACIKSQSALTDLVVLERGKYHGADATKVLLIPYTGRTHQLRVHCQYLNHIIVGDYAYSNRTDISPYRMMLHAHRLIIPLRDRTLDVTAPDPFVPEVDSRWQPSEICETFDNYLEELVILNT